MLFMVIPFSKGWPVQTVVCWPAVGSPVGGGAPYGAWGAGGSPPLRLHRQWPGATASGGPQVHCMGPLSQRGGGRHHPAGWGSHLPLIYRFPGWQACGRHRLFQVGRFEFTMGGPLGRQGVRTDVSSVMLRRVEDMRPIPGSWDISGVPVGPGMHTRCLFTAVAVMPC